MPRAQKLLPVDRSLPEDQFPGMELTDQHLERLDIEER